MLYLCVSSFVGSPLNYEDRGEKMTVITPFLIAMTVVIVLFLVLILVGFITEEGELSSSPTHSIVFLI